MPSNSILEVIGSPLQRGLSQGEAFASQKEKYFAAMKNYPNLPPWIRPLVLPGLVRLWLRHRGKGVKNLILPVLSRSFSGDWESRLEGMAQGFGMSLYEAYGFNSVEILTAKTPVEEGCTSLAFSAGMTEEKTPILAYNHDYISIFAPFLIVRRNRVAAPPALENLYASLSLTYQPAVGAIAGVNEKGLAVSLNHGYTTDEIRPGVPLAFLVQTCLDRCASTAEAVALIKKIPVPCGGIMTFVDAFGDCAAMELAPSRRALREMTDEPLFSFNQYQMHKMQSVEIPQNAVFPWWFYPVLLRGKKFHQFNRARKERYEALVKKGKKWSRDGIIKILSDHGAENRPGRLTICRHQPETADTVASALIYPEKRKMEICVGNPCRNEYRRFAL